MGRENTCFVHCCIWALRIYFLAHSKLYILHVEWKKKKHMSKYRAQYNLPFWSSQVFILYLPAPGLLCLGFRYCLYMNHVQTLSYRKFLVKVSFLFMPCVCFLNHLSVFMASCFILVLSSLGCSTLAAHSGASRLNDDWSWTTGWQWPLGPEEVSTLDYGPADSPVWPCQPAHFY